MLDMEGVPVALVILLPHSERIALRVEQVQDCMCNVELAQTQPSDL